MEYVDKVNEIECPQCGAEIGKPCGPGMLQHKARVDKWKEYSDEPPKETWYGR